MRRLMFAWIGATVTSLSLLGSQAFAQTAIFTPIDIPPAGTHLMFHDLSGDGSTIVGTMNHSAGNEAFRWTLDAGVVSLPHLTPNHTSNHGYGVSNDGSIVVGTATLGTGTETDSFAWTESQGASHIGGVNDGLITEARDVSGDGATVVGFRRPSVPGNVFVPYRWTTTGGFEFLGSLPGGSDEGLALGVSFDGKAVIGVSESASGREAFLWREGSGLVGLGDLPGGEYTSYAADLSKDGSVVVGSSVVAGFGRGEYQYRAYRWTQATGMVDLGLLADGLTALPSSNANGVSADGNIIVGEATSTRNQNAFMWTPDDGMRSLWDILTVDYGLDLNDWQLTDAAAISADGRTIVGGGLFQGQRRYWHVELNAVPEPTAFILALTSGLFGIAHRRRRAG